MSAKLELLGVYIGSIDDSKCVSKGACAYVFNDEKDHVYKHLNITVDGKKIVGATLVGDCENYDTLLQYFLNGMGLPENPESLMLPASAAVCQH